MTQKEKQLLLKDLLPRQLYGVKVHYRYHDFVGGSERLIHEGDGVIKSINLTLGNPILIDGFHIEVENVKPYLRPMSSMTEEEKKEHDFYCGYKPYDDNIGESYLTEYDMPDYIDFLYEHYLDFRGLIPIGLALEATEGMYKNE